MLFSKKVFHTTFAPYKSPGTMCIRTFLIGTFQSKLLTELVLFWRIIGTLLASFYKKVLCRNSIERTEYGSKSLHFKLGTSCLFKHFSVRTLCARLVSLIAWTVEQMICFKANRNFVNKSSEVCLWFFEFEEKFRFKNLMNLQEQIPGYLLKLIPILQLFCSFFVHNLLLSTFWTF